MVTIELQMWQLVFILVYIALTQAAIGYYLIKGSFTGGKKVKGK